MSKNNKDVFSWDIVKANDPQTWIDVLWYLALYHKNNNLDTDDQEWDDICTVISWINKEVTK